MYNSTKNEKETISMTKIRVTKTLWIYTYTDSKTHMKIMPPLEMFSNHLLKMRKKLTAY